jgi:hypothetical protein
MPDGISMTPIYEELGKTVDKREIGHRSVDNISE